MEEPTKEIKIDKIIFVDIDLDWRTRLMLFSTAFAWNKTIRVKLNKPTIKIVDEIK